MNFIRKLIQKTGFDLHRHSPTVNKLIYLKNLNIQSVLDVGANTGQFASEIRRVLPKAQIYSFEPLKECFDALPKENKNFNFALGERNEKVEMNKSTYTPSSSLLPMSDVHKELFPHTQEHTKETIEVKRLDDLNLKLELEILIKVDVQGFEDKVIAGGENTFRKSKAVILETSFLTLYEDQAVFETLYDVLRNLGFKYHGSLQQKINKITGEVISEDSLFTK